MYMVEYLAAFEYIVVCIIILRERKMSLERLYYIAANASWDLPECKKIRNQEKFYNWTFWILYVISIVIPCIISVY